jgi:hypothetical protein
MALKTSQMHVGNWKALRDNWPKRETPKKKVRFEELKIGVSFSICKNEWVKTSDSKARLVKENKEYDVPLKSMVTVS